MNDPEVLEPKPILLYDGACGFCRRWIERWQAWSGDRVRFLPYQDFPADQAPAPLESLSQTIHLLRPDGSFVTGGQAVLEALAPAKKYRFVSWLYRRLPLFASLTEKVYGVVARHRIFFSRITRFLWGRDLRPPTYSVASWLFSKGLALIYACAFLSLGLQILGLVGSHGILPIDDSLAFLKIQYGPERYWKFPTLYWISPSDSSLLFLCFGGLVLSILAFLGTAPGFVFLLLWGFYLSLVTVGQEFLGFQWDNLLLETGFLTLFLVPWKLQAFKPKAFNPSAVSVWLIRLLLFKLMFLSGKAKLASGDETWTSLTAMVFHYETQPLPTWIAWHLHHWPLWFHKMETFMTLFIELVIPFSIFLPRRPRLITFVLFSLLQIFIMLTGNYGFFNPLVFVLGLMLLDDASLRRLPGFSAFQSAERLPSDGKVPTQTSLAFVPLVIFLISLGGFLGLPTGASSWFRPVQQVLAPLRSLNSYGLFAVMTTKRYEVIIEGSNDGFDWQEYEFKWKPGDITKKPAFIQPHMPRLDWQMWFLALGDERQIPWFKSLVRKIKEGEPQVMSLLDKNPFPQKPPLYVRTSYYEYEFSDPQTKATTDRWWARRHIR